MEELQPAMMLRDGAPLNWSKDVLEILDRDRPWRTNRLATTFSWFHPLLFYCLRIHKGLCLPSPCSRFCHFADGYLKLCKLLMLIYCIMYEEKGSSFDSNLQMKSKQNFESVELFGPIKKPHCSMLCGFGAMVMVTYRDIYVRSVGWSRFKILRVTNVTVAKSQCREHCGYHNVIPQSSFTFS